MKIRLHQGFLIVCIIILVYLYPKITTVFAVVLGGLLYLNIPTRECNKCTAPKSGGNDIRYLLDNLSKTTILGQGGAGIVYTILDDPILSKHAYKMSKDMGTCREWQKEYALTVDLQNKLKHLKTKYVEFVPIEDYYGSDTYCVMKMMRIHNPISDDTPYAIHAMFGEKHQNYLHKTRGLSLGYSELLKYIPEDDMAKYFSELGYMMGHIHYTAKYDGYDLEIILGKEDGMVKLYIIDFDLIEKITEYNDDTKNRLFEVFAYVPYFPTIETPHYTKFRESYLTVAFDNNLSKFAERVIKEYEDS